MKEGYTEYQIWEGRPPATQFVESHANQEHATDRYNELVELNPNCTLRLLKAEWGVVSTTPLAST